MLCIIKQNINLPIVTCNFFFKIISFLPAEVDLMFSCLLRSNCISPVSTNSSPICTPTAHRSTFCSPCFLVPAKFLSCFSDGCVWITSHHLKLTWLKNPFRMSTEALLSAFFLRAGDISNILSHI